MALFAGKLHARIRELEAALEAARLGADTLRGQLVAAEGQAAMERDAAREARQALQKQRQKDDRAGETRATAEKRAQGLAERAASLKDETAELRAALLAEKRSHERTRTDLLTAQAEIARLELTVAEREAEVRAPRPAPERAPRPAPERVPDPARADARVERLEEQLGRLKGERDAATERAEASREEARTFERKLRAEAQRAETTLRDLQHNLRAERRAYKILQSQFEAQVDRVRGLEQVFEARLAQAVAEARPTEEPTQTPRVVAAPTPATLAERLPDAPPASAPTQPAAVDVPPEDVAPPASASAPPSDAPLP
jgi:chromosome segregation ATPase